MPRKTGDTPKTKITKKAPVKKEPVKKPAARVCKKPVRLTAADRVVRLNALREIIDAAAMIAALEKHVLGAGQEGLTPSQVSTALALLKKVLPDVPASAALLEEAAGSKGGKKDIDVAVVGVASHEDALLDLE